MKSINWKLTIVAACAIVVAINASAVAQPMGGLGFIVGLPQGELDDNIENNGFGLDFYGGYGLDPLPLMIGADLGILQYGSESREEPFSNTIPDVTVKVETKNTIFLGHALLRLGPTRGAVRPYLDGLIGLKVFSTDTSVKDDSDDEEIASSNNQRDTSFSYGVGGGLNIQLYQSPAPTNDSPTRVFLDLQVRYLPGGEAEYLKEGSITRENGQIKYDLLRSETDLITTFVGVTVSF